MRLLAWIWDGALTLGVLLLVLAVLWGIHELMNGELAHWLRGWL